MKKKLISACFKEINRFETCIVLFIVRLGVYDLMYSVTKEVCYLVGNGQLRFSKTNDLCIVYEVQTAKVGLFNL